MNDVMSNVETLCYRDLLLAQGQLHLMDIGRDGFQEPQRLDNLSNLCLCFSNLKTFDIIGLLHYTLFRILL